MQCVCVCVSVCLSFPFFRVLCVICSNNCCCTFCRPHHDDAAGRVKLCSRRTASHTRIAQPTTNVHAVWGKKNTTAVDSHPDRPDSITMKRGTSKYEEKASSAWIIRPRVWPGLQTIVQKETVRRNASTQQQKKRPVWKELKLLGVAPTNTITAFLAGHSGRRIG